MRQQHCSGNETDRATFSALLFTQPLIMSIDRWILLTKGEGAGGLPTAGALVPGCDEFQLLTEGRPPAEDGSFLPVPQLYS